MKHLHPRLRPVSLAATAALLAACASAPLQPDLTATAPLLEGFGTLQTAATTANAKARQHFLAGMAQAYAFNEQESQRQFKAALAADPRCALCAWGVAWQMGPIINRPVRGDLKEAQRYIDLALRNAAANPAVTERERALIAAMALRYAHESTTREAAPMQAAVCGTPGGDTRARHPLDQAYADRLRELVQRWPQDADTLSLWAEAEMVATPARWFDPVTGAPAARMGDVATALETLLQAQPGHTGLNHYLIHAVDTRPTAHRAVAAAERLGALAPNSPHLVHMPAHTFAHVGRYAEATAVNQRAVQADVELGAKVRAQGHKVVGDWTYHNLHFLWFGALMEGRGELALSSARQLATMTKDGWGAYGEYVRSLPALTLLRLQRFAELAAEPAPKGDAGLAAALHGHAVAVARLRQQGAAGLPQAQAALAAVTEAAAKVAKAHTRPEGFDKVLRELSEGAQARLQAEVALAQGDATQALAQQQRAVTLAERADMSEPPMLGAGARVALAQMQLQAGRAADAEATSRRDLALWTNSGWALRNLQAALQAQGKAADAQALAAPLAQAWPLADASLRR